MSLGETASDGVKMVPFHNSALDTRRNLANFLLSTVTFPRRRAVFVISLMDGYVCASPVHCSERLPVADR